ncbi:16S rRNA (cytosine(967)-C(5))-methyltransferase RsmB [Peptoniphilus sp.]|jgi:16S rRNA (cytosine967-C5)-methyltransferase|uniref:16S rRNA (cytosine(967)-C(5))-methyltransferase RsmB n=1 Tax=Peptoniphilus sp. TaxID=1971214 RepID=UPI003D91CE01
MKNAREKALLILNDVFYKGAFLEEQLEILSYSKIDKRDYAFIKEITTGVVRNRTYLDYVVRAYSKIKFSKIHKIILTILEMSIYQMFFLDRVPNYSIISESVELAKIYGNKGSVGFTNGILRTISKLENKPQVKIKDSIDNLSTYYSHPRFYTEYFYNNYSEDFTKKLLKSNNEMPPFTVRINTLKINRDDFIKELGKEGFSYTKTHYNNALNIENPEGIIDSDLFSKGFFYVQDLASILVSEYLNPDKDSKVLDLCASPGGKTTHISAIMENTGEVIACDKNKAKLNTIIENAKRLGSTNIKTKLNDATIFNKDFENEFDYCLVDAPCSGIGLYRKKPDIKWNKNIEDIENLSKIQISILENAKKYIKPGGTIVYSTCSVSKIENEDVISKFLKENSNFKIEQIEGYDTYKMFPHINNSDGFSITRLIKIS